MLVLVTLVVSVAWFLVLAVVDATVPGVGTWILVGGSVLGAGLFGLLITRLIDRSREMAKVGKRSSQED